MRSTPLSSAGKAPRSPARVRHQLDIARQNTACTVNLMQQHQLVCCVKFSFTLLHIPHDIISTHLPNGTNTRLHTYLIIPNTHTFAPRFQTHEHSTSPNLPTTAHKHHTSEHICTNLMIYFLAHLQEHLCRTPDEIFVDMFSIPLGLDEVEKQISQPLLNLGIPHTMFTKKSNPHVIYKLPLRLFYIGPAEKHTLSKGKKNAALRDKGKHLSMYIRMSRIMRKERL